MVGLLLLVVVVGSVRLLRVGKQSALRGRRSASLCVLKVGRHFRIRLADAEVLSQRWRCALYRRGRQPSVRLCIADTAAPSRDLCFCASVPRTPRERPLPVSYLDVRNEGKGLLLRDLKAVESGAEGPHAPLRPHVEASPPLLQTQQAENSQSPACTERSSEALPLLRGLCLTCFSAWKVACLLPTYT